jgi:transcriptional regulator with XRE-family HTH domain
LHRIAAYPQQYTPKNGMSMHICNKSLPIRIVDYDKRFVVDKQQHESLADFVSRVRNEKGFSLSKVEANAAGEIDSSYISRVENGHIKNVSPEKLKALARGLQVSEDEIFDRARNKKRIGEEDRSEISRRLIEAAHKFDAMPHERRPQKEMQAEPLIDVLERVLAEE